MPWDTPTRVRYKTLLQTGYSGRYAAELLRAFLVNIISNNLDHNLFLNYLYQELLTIYKI
jgi:hypothetical protein